MRVSEVQEAIRKAGGIATVKPGWVRAEYPLRWRTNKSIKVVVEMPKDEFREGAYAYALGECWRWLLSLLNALRSP